MNVITLKAHWNKFGTFAPGETYEHDDPAADLILGHVKDANDSEAGRVRGAGGKVGATQKRDSQEQNAEGATDGGTAGS